MDVSLQGLLQRAVRLNPDGMCTRMGDREHSWREVESRAARFAAGLRGLGLERGDRIALLSLNSDRYYESIFAIPWAGYCMMPLNTRWALPENNYALSDSGTRVLLFDDAFQVFAGCN